MSEQPLAVDVELGERAREGDLEAFSELVVRYAPGTYDFLLRVTGSHSAASKQLRATFLALMESPPEGPFHIAAYAEARRHALPGASVPDESLQQMFARPTAEVDAETAAAAWKTLRGQDPETFAAYTLHAQQGLSVADVAAISGVSAGSAAAMLVRVKQDLADTVGLGAILASDCIELRDLRAALTDADASATRSLVFDTHLPRCGTCQDTRRASRPASDVYAFAPVVAPSETVAAVQSAVAAVWDESGPAAQRGKRRRRLALLIGITLIALLAVLAVAATAHSSGGGPDQTAPASVGPGPGESAGWVSEAAPGRDVDGVPGISWAGYRFLMDVAYPGFGRVIVDGVEYHHDVVIEADVVRKRDKGPSRSRRSAYGHTPLTADEEIPLSAPRLVIGTGASGRLPVMPDVAAVAAASGVEVTMLPTADASALLQEMGGEPVSAILHVTC